MQTKTVCFGFSILSILWSGLSVAQSIPGEVRNWEDGRPMDCRYVFEQELLLEWNLIDPPPVTIETVNAIVTLWTEQQGLRNPAVLNYKLIPVRPVGHDYQMMVWFVEFIAAEPAQGFMPRRLNDTKKLAITMSGIVVEPECDGA